MSADTLKRSMHSKACTKYVENIRLDEYSGSLADCLYTYYRKYLENRDILISDICSWPCTLFRRLDVPVAGWQSDDYVMHRIRCTDKDAFRKGEPRNDWCWIRTGTADANGALRGLLPARVIRLLKLKDSIRDRPRCLALVKPLKVRNRGAPGENHTLVRVIESPTEDGHLSQLWIVNIKSIWGLAHLVPESTEPGNRNFFVNNSIDLLTFNTIYQ